MLYDMLNGPQRSRRRRVLIVGCGFGGLFAARSLRDAGVEVVVMDRNNYHLFQPLLYQVAAAALTPSDIAQPIRRILRRDESILTVLAEARQISLAERCVFVDQGCIRYDYLILAPERSTTTSGSRAGSVMPEA